MKNYQNILPNSFKSNISREDYLRALGGKYVLSYKIEGFVRYFSKHFSQYVEIPVDRSCVLDVFLDLWDFADDYHWKIKSASEMQFKDPEYKFHYIITSSIGTRYTLAITWDVESNKPRRMTFGKNMSADSGQHYIEFVFFYSYDDLYSFDEDMDLVSVPIVDGERLIYYGFEDTWVNGRGGNDGDITEQVP